MERKLFARRMCFSMVCNCCLSLLVLATGLASMAFPYQPPTQAISIQATAGPHVLLKTALVQKVLGVSEESGKEFTEWANMLELEGRDRMQDELSKLIANGLKMNEVQAKVTQLRAELADRAYAELTKKLTIDQLERLRSIEIQCAGPQIFLRPDIRRTLEITKEQQGRIQHSIDELALNVNSLKLEMGLPVNPAAIDIEKRKEFELKQYKLHELALKEIVGVLTPEQRSQFDGLRGETIDVQTVRLQLIVPPTPLINR